MKIGTHEFEPALDPYKRNNDRYFRCINCGIIVFESWQYKNRYLISYSSDSSLVYPAEISCNDWIIREIIE